MYGIRNIQPDAIMSDFELGILNACKEVCLIRVNQLVFSIWVNQSIVGKHVRQNKTKKWIRNFFFGGIAFGKISIRAKSNSGK